MYKQVRIYSCGHREEVKVKNKPNESELKIALPCQQCRNKANDSILTVRELDEIKPKLKGSPAQIKYGDINRQRFISEWVRRASDKQAEIIRSIIKNEAHGGFWMDNKDVLKDEAFVNGYVPGGGKKGQNGKAHKPYNPSKKSPNKNNSTGSGEDWASRQGRNAAQELKQDIINHIVKPDTLRSNILIYIELENKTTVNAYPTQYNDEIEDILKKLGYSYLKEKNCHTRQITEYTGNYIDRAAELGVKFNDCGYSVSVLNTKVMGMIHRREYKPEITRWVKRYNPTHLYLDWQGYERVLCNRALSFISGAYWEQNFKKVIVPVSSYKDIQIYADRNGFAIDSRSRVMIENERRNHRA